MRHYWSLNDLTISGCGLTIGAFDGVHRGHQAILAQLAEHAHTLGLPAVALTFYPHPGAVLGKRKDPFYLTTPEERARYLGEAGADIVVTHPFSRDFSHLPAQTFLELLARQIAPRYLLVGPDFALGRGREGDVAYLGAAGPRFGFELAVAAPVTADGAVISSSRVRQHLRAGEVAEAAHLLGRPFALTGAVISGDGRGRTLGIPTANLDLWRALIAPAEGVYACRAWVGRAPYLAVTNVGVRPTFETEPVPPRIEAHLLDFSGGLYGRELKLEFLARLRPEQRFPSVAALVAQIDADIAAARRLFPQPTP
jgi:riboflavin kinase/FMN adenylyltransferase